MPSVAPASPPPQKPRGCLGCALRLVFLSALTIVLGVYGVGRYRDWHGTRLAGLDLDTGFVAIPADAVELAFDVTGTRDGNRDTEQETFDALLGLIERAGDLLVLDEFLVNQFRGQDAAVFRNTTGELTAALVHKQQTSPDTWIVFITDPINSLYGTRCPAALAPLVAAGGHVIVTDLDGLPDSNLLYSPFYRTLGPLLPRSAWLRRPRLPAPFDPKAGKMSMAEYAALLNFKANHRKVAVCHTRDGHWEALVSSANPHSASSAHSNLAVLLRDGPVTDIVRGELELARSSIQRRADLCFSAAPAADLARECLRRLTALPRPAPRLAPAATGPAVRYCTDAAIGRAVDEALARSGPGDCLDMMMFYLADPAVIRGLKHALERGVHVRLLLDPNKDAFGRSKNGVPNRVLASDLVAWAARRHLPLTVRWFATHGEQGHSKSLHVYRPGTGRDEIVLGSANFTSRNLRGSNAEADLVLRDLPATGQRWHEVFQRLWENQGGAIYSVAYSEYGLTGPLAQWSRRVQTAVGNCTGFCTY